MTTFVKLLLFDDTLVDDDDDDDDDLVFDDDRVEIHCGLFHEVVWSL